MTRLLGSVLVIVAASLVWTGPPTSKQLSQTAPIGGNARVPVASGYSNIIVAPDGHASSPGTMRRPLDLESALSAKSPAKPGDTIWLRGGIYRGPIESRLTGTADHPIVVRTIPGERAVIDGRSSAEQVPTLSVEGAYAWYWGFEVTNSAPDRAIRGTGVQVYGPHTRFINLVVHGTGNGFGVWSPAIDSELYGNLIFDNGWDGADRGHGHSIYVQNQTGTKRIVDNILFDSYSFGIHGYTERGYIDNIYIEGNIAFNHGVISKTSGAKANILVGGYRVANGATVVANYTYYPSGSAGRNADIGYVTGCRGATIKNNYFVGGVPLVVTACEQITVENNTILAKNPRSLAAQFAGNTFLAEPPQAPTVIVRANRYESGRAHVVVYNWTRERDVVLSLTESGLRTGDSFEVRDAQHYFDEPLVRATFSGEPIRLPMRRQEAIASDANPGEFAEFEAFIVVKTGKVAPPRSRPGRTTTSSTGKARGGRP